MLFRALSRSLLAVLFAISGKAQFEIRGSRLYLDREPFSIHGVAYGPTPVGALPGTSLEVSACLYGRDLPLMARAGINTVRVYGKIRADDAPFRQALDRSDLYLLAGFPLDPYHDPGSSLAAGSELRARILREFREYAEQWRDQRRLLALILGNEVARDYNRKFAGSPRDFYSLVDEAAAGLRPVLVTTAVADVTDIGIGPLGTRDPDLPNLAFWAVNLYRGLTLDGALDSFRQRSGKAVLVSEFGVDALNEVRQVEDAETQASWLRNLLRLLQQEEVLGSVVFEWTDEWWRGGPSPQSHGPAGELRPGFPDGRANSGWFGLFGLSTHEVPGLDGLRPRPAFAVLAEEWGGKLPANWPEREQPRPTLRSALNAGSRVRLVAPGALLSLFGDSLVEPSAPDLTFVCLASRPAPLLSLGVGQIDSQVPWETPLGAAPVLVYQAGIASTVITVDVREIAPGILNRGVLEAGKPCPVSLTNGVRPGAYLEVYGTGLGSVSATLPTGTASALPWPTDVVPRAFLGSRELRVAYSGLVPGVLGVYQTNTQVPEDFPFSTVGLRLFSGGIESNAYQMTVLSEFDRPGLVLGSSLMQFLVQAGGPPRSAELAIEGRSGFCELVQFTVTGVPAGVSVSVPVGFPGQRIPVTVQASTQTRGMQDVEAVAIAVSSLPEHPMLHLRISVLPSRGDIPFRVISGGARAGLVAQFEMAGQVLFLARGGGPGRGFHFVVLNGDTGVLGPTRSFDTWASQRASEDMADYLTALPVGTIVLGAIADEGTFNLTARARTALRRILSSQLSDSLLYQDSWAIITRVGAQQPIAEGAARAQLVALEKVLTF